MLSALSFAEACDFLNSCRNIFGLFEEHLGQAAVEVMSDSVNLFAQDPELWGCDEDGDYAALMALCFHQLGYNSLKPEHDVTLKFLVNSKSQNTGDNT